jgi:hypothetical protein
MSSWRDNSTPLRQWLRKTPVAAKFRVRTVEDEEKTIAVEAASRTRWKDLEEAILALDPRTVEALDASGNILRAQKIAGDDDDAPAENARKQEDKRVAYERRELAAFAEAMGRQLNSAFDRGAAAANTGQQNLVELVDNLTQHLSLAITNLHNASVNLANMVQQQADQGSGSNGALDHMLGALATRALGGGMATPPTAPNGKGKRHE